MLRKEVQKNFKEEEDQLGFPYKVWKGFVLF